MGILRQILGQAEATEGEKSKYLLANSVVHCSLFGEEKERRKERKREMRERGSECDKKRKKIKEKKIKEIVILISLFLKKGN